MNLALQRMELKAGKIWESGVVAPSSHLHFFSCISLTILSPRSWLTVLSFQPPERLSQFRSSRSRGETLGRSSLAQELRQNSPQGPTAETRKAPRRVDRSFKKIPPQMFSKRLVTASFPALRQTYVQFLSAGNVWEQEVARYPRYLSSRQAQGNKAAIVTPKDINAVFTSKCRKHDEQPRQCSLLFPGRLLERVSRLGEMLDSLQWV